MKINTKFKVHFYLIFLIFLTLNFSCKSTDMRQHSTSHADTVGKLGRQSEVSRKNDLNKIISKLESYIANTFFDSEKRRIIKVHLKKVSSNYRDELQLADYLYHKIRSHIDSQIQFQGS